jgi:predicted acylesterase/phospholipase RssA
MKNFVATLQGVLTIAGCLVWLNMFVVATVVLSAGTLLTQQGTELLRLAHGTEGFAGKLLRLYGPICFSGGFIALSSFLTIAISAKPIRNLQRRCGLNPGKVAATVFVIVPVAFGSTPALIASLRSGFADLWTVTVGTIGVLAVALTHVVIRRPTGTFGFPWLSPRRLVWLALIIFVVTVVGFYTLLPVDHARAVGTLGIIMVVGALWSLVLSCIFIAVPIAYGLPSLALVPLLAVLFAGLYVDPNIFPHAHPTPTRIPEAPGEWTLDQRRAGHQFELTEWCRQFIATPGDERIPLYLVSAEGGGIRAAYWSAAVLAEMDAKTHGDFRKHVLVFSGVSGGSLGVAAFATAAIRNQVAPEKLKPLMRQYFSNDFLSPLVVHLMITEPVRALLGDWSHLESRDRAFEDALARDWQRVSGEDDLSRPFLETFGTNERDSSAPFFPIVWFNSTIVETGLRALISNIQTGRISPTPSDLLRQDAGDRRNLDRITVAEAVHLSARFPFVSPPATILTDVSVDPDPNHHEKRLWGHLVDGGYLDNSAADNFLQLLNFIDEERKNALQCYAHRYSDCSPDPEDQKILNVKRRIQIIVIPIRNDPLDRGARIFDIPSLMSVNPDSIIEASPCAVCSFKNGFLSAHLPSALSSEEVAGPPDALAASREARGAVTRETLHAAMVEGVPNSYSVACIGRLTKAAASRRGVSRSDFMAVGLAEPLAKRVQDIWAKANACSDIADSERYTILYWACEIRTDFYREDSLAQFLGDSNISGACKSRGPNLGSLRGIALGWTLSEGVQERIACIADKVQPPDLISDVGVALPHACSPD